MAVAPHSPISFKAFLGAIPSSPGIKSLLLKPNQDGLLTAQ